MKLLTQGIAKNGNKMGRVVGGSSVVLTAALLLTAASLGTKPAVPLVSAASRPQWFVQTALASNFPRLTLSTFQHFAQEGVTGVEVNVSWSGIEPEPGVFRFQALNTYLHYAQETHLKLIPIFWQYISWYPNQPYWLPGGFEQTSLGYPAAEPPFWSHRAFDDYATFMQKTLEDANRSPAFGGAFIDYGWNDAGYGPSSSSGNGFTNGIAGYAPQDVTEFHVWLQQQYGTIARFDAVTKTTYAAWAKVPAFTPGSAHFAIYQQFRLWSYKTLLGRLLHMARETTTKTLYIYWGGGIGDASALGNLPDNVFALAHQYHAVIDDDNAEHTTFAALFGFLSQEYHVPLLEEESPNPTGVSQEEAKWLGQYPLEGGDRYGEDYFIFAGKGNESGYFAGTWSRYLAWHAALAKVQGNQPHEAVGIMLGYDRLFAMNSGIGLPGDTSLLGKYLRTERPAADVFTDLSVLNGAVKLDQFKTIVDWNNDLEAPGLSPRLVAMLHAFEAHGGKIIPGPSAATISVGGSQATRERRTSAMPKNLVLNPSGADGTTGWHLGSANGGIAGSTLGVTTVSGAPALQWTVSKSTGQSEWADYNPAVTAGDTYTYSATLSGSGQVQLNFWNGVANVPGKTVTLSGIPQTVSETVTIAANSVADPQVQVLAPTAENATVDIQDASVVATPAAATPVRGGLLTIPAQFIVTPNNPEVETFASVSKGKAFIVVSNFSPATFSGSVEIPQEQVRTLLPNDTKGTVHSTILLGHMTQNDSTAGVSWKVSLPTSSIGVIQIQAR